MPSQFDNTYMYRQAQPSYTSEQNRQEYDAKHEFEVVFEEQLPPVPTREMELEYQAFLEQSFRNDPWITYRFRKYMASPKRIPWTNVRYLKISKRRKFMADWITGFCFFWPIACALGRYSKTTRGGVPVYPMPLVKFNFPNVQYHNEAKRHFRRVSKISALAVGFTFALTVSDHNWIMNRNHNSPDLKPFPAMVAPKQGLEKVAEDYMLHQKYGSRDGSYMDNWRQSAVVRFFAPNHADWTSKTNPFSLLESRDLYDHNTGYYVTHTNDFQDHAPH